MEEAMRRFRFCAASLPLLLLTAAGAGAQGAGKAKAAATPEEAVNLIVACMKAGNYDDVLVYLAEPVRTITWFQLEQARIREAFEDAVEAKLGKDAKAPPRVSMKD